MADHDRIEGAAKNIGGKIKEGVGKVTGDITMPEGCSLFAVIRNGKATPAPDTPSRLKARVLFSTTQV